MRWSTVAEAAVSAWPSTWPPNTCGLPMSRLAPRNRFTSSGSSSSICSRSASCGFMRMSSRDSIRHPEPLVHDRARGRVLQELALLRIQMMLDGEGGERRLVEARQDELFLARIGVDVAH